MRKYPPLKPSGLAPGAQYRVVRAFTAGAVTFEQNEILTFEGEGFIPDEQVDVWRFTPPQESMKLKEIVGSAELANPETWRDCFAIVTQATDAQAAEAMETLLARTAAEQHAVAVA